MVGTAQADSLTIFIRKVGFSVGLESLLSRAADFGQRYSDVASFREADWNELVYKRWDLRSGNIADVFSALDIARVTNQEVYAGNTGEALGIVHHLLAGEALEKAVRFLVAKSIVQFDGDVFLNALAVDFKPERTAEQLVKMVLAKREALFGCFKGPRDREAIARVVSIERQRSNKGSSSGGGLAGLERSAPLGIKTQGLGLPAAIDVYAVDAPSPDYIRKVTVSRRGWAQSLGFFQNGGRTPEGDRFLVGMSSSGFGRPDGVFLVWPTQFELEAHRFRPENFGGLGILSTWEFQLSIFRSMGGEIELGIANRKSISDEIVKIFRIYKELSQHRSMIRNEMSSHVAFSVLLALAFAEGRAVPNVREVLEDDLTEFGLVIRQSKTIEQAITTRPDAGQTP